MRGREKNKQKTEIITLKLTPSLDFNENSQIGTITSNSVQGDKRRVQYCKYIILGQFDSQKIEVQSRGVIRISTQPRQKYKILTGR